MDRTLPRSAIGSAGRSWRSLEGARDFRGLRRLWAAAFRPLVGVDDALVVCARARRSQSVNVGRWKPIVLHGQLEFEYRLQGIQSPDRGDELGLHATGGLSSQPRVLAGTLCVGWT